MSREKMEEEINEGKFIEFGEYKGNLYGTSAETVKTLINSGFFCILTPHYQVGHLKTNMTVVGLEFFDCCVHVFLCVFRH